MVQAKRFDIKTGNRGQNLRLIDQWRTEIKEKKYDQTKSQLLTAMENQASHSPVKEELIKNPATHYPSYKMSSIMSTSTILLILIIALQALVIFIVYRQKEASESMAYRLKDIESDQRRNHMHITRNVDQLGHDLSKFKEQNMVDIVKINESLNFTIERLKYLQQQYDEINKKPSNEEVAKLVISELDARIKKLESSHVNASRNIAVDIKNSLTALRRLQKNQETLDDEGVRRLAKSVRNAVSKVKRDLESNNVQHQQAIANLETLIQNQIAQADELLTELRTLQSVVRYKEQLVKTSEDLQV